MSSRKSYPRHVSLYLSQEQHDRLQRHINRHGGDASKHLRRALELYLDPPKPAPPKREKAMPTGEVLPIVLMWSD